MKTKLIPIVLLLLTSVVGVNANTIISNQNINVEKLINDQIEAKYNDAVIVETETENNQIKVDIIHQQKEKDVLFNNQGVWQSTKYDMPKSELPKKIKEVIENSKYSSYKISDVEVIETPSKNIYEIELDKFFSDEITIYVTFDGKIL